MLGEQIKQISGGKPFKMLKTYEETLEYLYRLLPMYQRQGKAAFKKDLTNINKLCFQLGFPQWKFKSIHLGGTNGKGSVSSMLASILQEAGYKTGLYTSPHLKSFTERIRVNGREISQKQLIHFVNQHQEMIEAIQPSFFEMTVAMAFEHFAQQEVDIAVIEVGLGGRLDSTNIISPELSVITNISMDHQSILGDSLEAIAGEKAGIIKKYTPVVIGETHAKTREVFKRKAEEMEADIYFASEEIIVERTSFDMHHQHFNISGNLSKELHKSYQLDLAGQYQAQNLATCMCAIEQLRRDVWEITPRAIQKGLKGIIKNTGLLGRMQVLNTQPLIICDTGHNEAGVQAIITQLAEIPHEQLHLVWGMLDDKDHEAILGLLPKHAHYYFVKPDVPRGMDAGLLSQKAAEFGLEGLVCKRVDTGLTKAQAAAANSDLILVGGSMFVVAEVLGVWPLRH